MHPKNTTARRQANKRWQQKNKEKVNATNRQWRIDNEAVYKECQRNSAFKHKYGIGLAEVEALLKKQKNRCAICRCKEPGGQGRWHVDHCHKTKKVRGLLCFVCNMMLGQAKDSPAILRWAADYLEAHGA